MMPPDAEVGPEGPTTKSAYQAARLPQRTQQVGQPGLDWLTAELAAVEEKLRAARQTIAARGIVPRPAIRSAAVQLVALDAAVGDRLDLVHVMRPEAVGS
jgi:hypothetical protein